MAGLTGLLGGLGGAGLGSNIGFLGAGLGPIGALFGANQQRKAADQFFSEGDPYRSQLRAISANPDLYFQGPIAQSLARQAGAANSAKFGAPSGSGTAQALTLQAMLNGYGSERDRLARMGGLADWNAAYPRAVQGKIGGYNNVTGSIMDLLGGLAGLIPGGGGMGAGGAAGAGDIPGTGSLA